MGVAVDVLIIIYRDSVKKSIRSVYSKASDEKYKLSVGLRLIDIYFSETVVHVQC